MNSRGEERQQSTVPDPVRLCVEHLSLGVAVISLTTSAVALLVEEYTAVVVFRGAYSVLAGIFVTGMLGWIVGSAERRVRRDLGGAVADLTAELAALREQVTHQRITYLPAPRRHGEGRRYIGAVAVRAETDPVGLDPACIDAARRISNRLRAVESE